MAASSRINARLDPQLARKVAAVQRKTKKALTEIVKESLELYCGLQLRGEGGSFETLTRTGFVGCADGPPDLSERYKQELTDSLSRKSS